jgi:hypothetical protein
MEEKVMIKTLITKIKKYFTNNTDNKVGGFVDKIQAELEKKELIDNYKFTNDGLFKDWGIGDKIVTSIFYHSSYAYFEYFSDKTIYFRDKGRKLIKLSAEEFIERTSYKYAFLYNESIKQRLLEEELEREKNNATMEL